MACLVSVGCGLDMDVHSLAHISDSVHEHKAALYAQDGYIDNLFDTYHGC